jgi:phosphoribosylanthranilate isomerase
MIVIKICGITTREDAHAAVEAGATALGFNFYPESPRYVTPEEAAELSDRLSVMKVGIFVNESPQAIAQKMATAGLQVAQVYGDMRYDGIRTWRACRVRSDDFKLPSDDRAEAFLLDGFSPRVYGGTGKTFPWSIAKGLPGRIVLAGGLDDGNVREAIRQAQPWGVDACSRIEKTPGRKDHEKMKRFIEAALSSSL